MTYPPTRPPVRGVLLWQDIHQHGHIVLQIRRRLIHLYVGWRRFPRIRFTKFDFNNEWLSDWPPGSPEFKRVKVVRPRRLVDDRESITCPTCRRRSYNPNDIRERYCGFCCAYH